MSRHEADIMEGFSIRGSCFDFLENIFTVQELPKKIKSKKSVDHGKLGLKRRK